MNTSLTEETEKYVEYILDEINLGRLDPQGVIYVYRYLANVIEAHIELNLFDLTGCLDSGLL